MSDEKQSRKRSGSQDEDDTTFISPSKRTKSPVRPADPGGQTQPGTSREIAGPRPNVEEDLAGISKIIDKESLSEIDEENRPGPSRRREPSPPRSGAIGPRGLAPYAEPSPFWVCRSPPTPRSGRLDSRPGPSRIGLPSVIVPNPSATTDPAKAVENRCNIQAELAKTIPFEWGKILSDAFELNCQEKTIPSSASFHNDAESMKSEADGEADRIVRVRKYLKAGALFIVAAEYMERTERKPRKALDEYQRLRSLLDETADLLGEGERGSQESRLGILRWKFKAWLDHRLHTLRRKLSVDQSFVANQAEFYEIVGALESMNDEDRPFETSVPVKVLLNIKKDVSDFEGLHEAFRLWNYAEAIISSHMDEAFFQAVESAVGRGINLLSRPNFFVKYIREFICRAEAFDGKSHASLR